MIGKKFGLLTVVKESNKGEKGRKSILFLCECDCGNQKIVSKSGLNHGNNKSCGCIHKTHGMRGTRFYESWCNMKARCDKPQNKRYANYGGRGIKIDPRWREFKEFYKDMHEGYSDDLTLDRIDVDGDYCKENCRWSDLKTQANNTNRNHYIEYKGHRYTIAEAAEKFNIKYSALFYRLTKAGWSVEKAIETPVGVKETLIFNGVEKEVKVYAKEYGMSYHTLKVRLHRGWSVEKALTHPLRK